MINSFYTLNGLAREFNDSFSGFEIKACLSQSRSELIVAIHNQDHGQNQSQDEPNEVHLRCSILPGSLYLFSDARFSRAKRNVAELFENAVGCSIDSVSVADRDRCIFLNLSDGKRLALALTGSSSNVYLVDENDSIIESFADNDKHAHQLFSQTRPAPEFPDRDDFTNSFQSAVTKGRDPIRALSSTYAFFDASVSRELFERSSLDSSRGTEFQESNLGKLYREARLFDKVLQDRPRPSIIEDNEGSLSFVLFEPFNHVANRKIFPSIDDAVRSFTIRGWSTSRFESTVLPVKKALGKAYKEVDKAVSNLEKGLATASRASQYRGWADLLMASQLTLESGADVISLPSFEDPASIVKIPVKAGLKRIELAEHYYEKAKKAEKRRLHDRSRLKTLVDEREHKKQLYDRVAVVSNMADWRVFESKYGGEISASASVTSGSSAGPAFRSYVLPEGYVVYVGKNATQNDKLTGQFARKDDYWLHARGVPGSHVVLRVKGREVPPPYILERAAQIAAFHSKARTSALAPVIVVRKKYVRKPRGAQKGTVIVDREEVLLVEPQIPQSR